MVKIKPEELQAIADYVYKISGIVLDSGKTYLIETRLGPLVEEFQCTSYADLHRKACLDSTKRIERKIVDAITTNETLFFRDTGPFDLLRHKILPEIVDRKTARSASSAPVHVHIWSAACATGQELYSIAMVIKDLMPEFQRQKINLLPRLVGSDISDAAIARASAGKYNRFEIERGLPPLVLQRYFTRDGDHWKISDELRAMVSFRKQNLLTGANGLGRFDIIFCRNVAIYFSVEDRKKLFHNMAAALHPDGCLIIGSTESLTGISDRFEPKRHLRTVYYQLKKPA